MTTNYLTLVTRKRTGKPESVPPGPVFVLNHLRGVIFHLYTELLPTHSGSEAWVCFQLCTRDADRRLPGPAHFRSAGVSLSQAAERRQDKRDF